MRTPAFFAAGLIGVYFLLASALAQNAVPFSGGSGASGVSSVNSAISVGGSLAPAVEPELIYGAELMTPTEREHFRAALGATGRSEERLRSAHQRQIRERARQRGVELKEPAGIIKRDGSKR